LGQIVPYSPISIRPEKFFSPCISTQKQKAKQRALAEYIHLLDTRNARQVRSKKDKVINNLIITYQHPNRLFV
jgi:hypothetical protein